MSFRPFVAHLLSILQITHHAEQMGKGPNRHRPCFSYFLLCDTLDIDGVSVEFRSQGHVRHVRIAKDLLQVIGGFSGRGRRPRAPPLISAEHRYRLLCTKGEQKPVHFFPRLRRSHREGARPPLSKIPGCAPASGLIGLVGQKVWTTSSAPPWPFHLRWGYRGRYGAIIFIIHLSRRGSRGGVRGVRTPPLVIKVLHFYCKTALSQRQSLRRCPLRMPFEKTLNPPLQEILDPRLLSIEHFKQSSLCA